MSRVVLGRELQQSVLVTQTIKTHVKKEGTLVSPVLGKGRWGIAPWGSLADQAAEPTQ